MIYIPFIHITKLKGHEHTVLTALVIRQWYKVILWYKIWHSNCLIHIFFVLLSQKEEAERKAKEEAEKREKELQERAIKQEIERNERKKVKSGQRWNKWDERRLAEMHCLWSDRVPTHIKQNLESHFAVCPVREINWIVFWNASILWKSSLIIHHLRNNRTCAFKKVALGIFLISISLND